MTEHAPHPGSVLAVLLGASRWPHVPSFRDCDGSPFERSYQRWKDYLLDAGGLGLPRNNVLDLFNDDRLPDQTCEEIRAFLSDRLTAGQEGRTDLLLYYVGHGVVLEKEYYLLLAQSRGETLKSHGLWISKLAELLKEHARPLRQYLLIDACYSGAANAAQWESKSGIGLLCSSSKHHASRASDQPAAAPSAPATPAVSKHTLFTGALLQVLAGSPLQPEDGSAEPPATHLSLRQLHERALAWIDMQFGEKGVRPEVHAPIQARGDVSNLPLFPCPWVPSREATRYELLTEAIQDAWQVRQEVEDRAAKREQEINALLRRQKREQALAGLVFIVLLFVAWRVWPTPYVVLQDEGNKDGPPVRANRFTGEMQFFDKRADRWLTSTEHLAQGYQDFVRSQISMKKTILSVETSLIRKKALCKELKGLIEKLSDIDEYFREKGELQRLCESK